MRGTLSGQGALDVIQRIRRPTHQPMLVGQAADAGLAQQVGQTIHHVPADTASTIVDHSQSRSASICASVRLLWLLL